MKTYILPLLLCVSLVTISGCVKEPIAEITADKSEVETGENVKFSNSSQEALSYEWNFGDGTIISTEKAPSHSWSTAGTYIVTMTAYSKKEKKKDEASLTVIVNDINKKFIGFYSISSNYTSDFCGSGTGFYMLTVSAGNSGNKIVIDNLAEGFNNVIGTVTGSGFSIASQIGVWVQGDQWDLNGGSGSLSGNNISYNITFDDILYLYDCGWATESGSGSK